MSDEDSEPEDARLRALRSVWLSMPDEDPPAAGLAELMAAARARAELLAQPPWWRRVFLQLRKPAVLAFATLLVVIGGAIAIGRRGDTVDSSGPVTAPTTPTTGTKETPPASPGGDAVPAKALPSGTISAPRDHGAPQSQGQSDRAVGGGEAQGEIETAPVAPPADGAAKAVSVPTPKVAPAVHHSPTPKKPSYSPPPEPRPALQVAPNSDFSSDPEVKKDTAKTPTAAVDSPAPADDLVSQARAAAARGDCAQANAISARVDARRSRQLAADPAVAKCATK